MRTCTSLLSFLVLFFGAFAFASPNSFTYQGRILKSDGTPLEYAHVSFLFEITNPTGTCVIYREQVDDINMLNSKGIFDVPIGSGTKLFPAAPTFKLVDAFKNSLGHNCSGGGSYTAASGDTRLLKVQFHDGNGWKVISPSNEIRSVPFSAFALSAETLGDKNANDFILKTGVPTCAANEFLSWNGTALVCAPVSGASGGTVTSVTSANSYVTITNNTSTPLVTLNVGTAAGTVAAGDDIRFTDARVPTGTAGGDLGGTYPNPSVAKIQNVAVSNAAPTSGHFMKFDGTQWLSSAIAISDVTNLNSTLSNYHTIAAFNAAVGSANCAAHQTPYWNSVAGSFQCQTINVSVAGDVSGSIGAVSVNKIKGVDVDTTGLAAGQVLKYDGTKWAPAADSNAGGTVTNIATGTGLSGGPITSTGTISLANTAVTPGSYTRASITVDAQGRLTAASSGAAINLASDVTGTLPIANGGTGQTSAVAAFNGLSPSTTKGDLIVHDGTNDIRLPVGTDGQVLSANSAQTSGVQWITPTNGTVTNVTGTAPIVVATGSTTPAISIDNATTSTKGAVQVGAGIAVSSGTISADPANFPSTVPVAKGGTGATSLTANRLLSSNGTGSAVTTFNCAVGQLVSFDATGLMICSTFTTGSVFLNGGNSFAGATTLGTNDGYSLNFETNGTTKVTIDTSGDIGIGSTSPTLGRGSNGNTRYVGIIGTGTSSNMSAGVLRLGGDTTTAAAGNLLGGIQFVATTNPGTSSIYGDAAILSTLEGAGGANGFGTALTFSTKKDNTNLLAEAVRISNSGNVGIGATSPAQKLDVAGVIRTGNATATAGSLMMVDAYTSGNLTTFGTEQSSGAPVLGYGVSPAATSQNFISSTPNANQVRSALALGGSEGIRFYQGASQTVATGSAVTMNEVMRIGQTGHVAIGTNSPTQRLTVQGASGAQSLIQVQNNDFVSGTTGSGAYLGTVSATGNVGTQLQAFYNGNTTAGPLYLNPFTGNVGVSVSSGTTVDKPLTVNGDVAVGITKAGQGYGSALWFRGVEDSSDSVWMSKVVASTDVSYLRVNVGDEGSDYFVVGHSVGGAPGGAWTNAFWVKTDGSGWMAGTLTQASDARLKKNIRPLDNSLEKILSLEGVTYNWIDKRKPAATQVGLIAQEVEKVYPELVANNEDGYKSVAYQNLVAPIINAIKELYIKVVGVDSRVDALEKKNQDLEAQNRELKAAICEMNPMAKICVSK